MIHIDGKWKYQTPFTGHRFSGSHQRVAASIPGFGKRISGRGEIHLRDSAQMHYIVIALLREMLLGSIRIAIFGNIGNQSIGFGIKAVEIFVIRYAYCIESCLLYTSDAADE